MINVESEAWLRLALVPAILALAVAGQVEGQQSPEGAWTIVEAWGQTPAGEDWRMAEEIQPSLFIFHDGYYSFTSVNGTEPRPPLPEGASRSSLTAEEGDAVWRSYLSNSGAYEVRDSLLITRPRVALWPPLMAEGFERAYEIAWDGSDLLITTRLYGAWRTWRLRRLE